MHQLTHFILMDFPKHVDRTSMGLSILYFKGSQVESFKLYGISVMKASFYLYIKVTNTNAALCGISSGSSLFAKVSAWRLLFPE